MTDEHPAVTSPAPTVDGVAGRAAAEPALSARRIVPAVLAGLGLVSLLYALAGVAGGALHDVRVVVTTVFLLLGPGWAVAAFLRARSLAERFVLAAATGTAIAILAGQVMAVSGGWHPVGLLLVLVVLVVPLLVDHARRGR